MIVVTVVITAVIQYSSQLIDNIEHDNAELAHGSAYIFTRTRVSGGGHKDRAITRSYQITQASFGI